MARVLVGIIPAPMRRRKNNVLPDSMNKKRTRIRQPLIQTCDYENIDWAQICHRAASFAEEYQTETRETAEAQTFWNDFFEVFGRTRRGLALYEYHARIGRDDKQAGFSKMLGSIDMLWPGVLAVEHKSAGKNLDEGQRQLFRYIDGLTDDKKPRYGLICDFARFRLIDLQTHITNNFSLSELPQNVKNFYFFIEHERKQFTLQLKANKDAAELIGGVYDALVDSGYDHEIDRLLMRLLFCMFADNTGIWKRGIFLEYLNDTRDDGTDLGARLEQIFDILNKKKTVRQKNLHSSLQEFSHINGGLFSERLDIAVFDSATRAALLEACKFDWSRISPDIFGALFQSVRDTEARRIGGEHYTSEKNILKIICPLFLDKLRRELERAGNNKSALKKLHDKIANLRFLDPACGCGNFLIIAYRELRLLEMEILLLLHPKIKTMNIDALCKINVDQFYGIEIDSFPASIAETAMWLVDHQMNLEVSEKFGHYYNRIPLTVSPHIFCGNALRIEWESVAPVEKISYILGNPPFVDRKNRAAKPEQQEDMRFIFNGAKGSGNLDYVAAWYMKAAHYIHNTDIQCAFVSTDSIAQSMQVAVLWRFLYAEKININFAHRSFKWHNEAGKVAQVRVIIIGFGVKEQKNKIIYDYPNPAGEPQKIRAANINAYLKDEPNVLVTHRRKPLCNVPAMNSGSNPLDNGHLLFSAQEKKKFLDKAPQAAEFMRPAIGGDDFVNGSQRWCLWLEDANPSVFRKIRSIKNRLDKVEEYRRNESSRIDTQKKAIIPHLFGENRQPTTKYLVVPQTTSGKRTYIPMGFVSKKKIALIKCQVVPSADLYHFGVLTSAMHMSWVSAVCGRLGGGYSYTASLVYNTFPWPLNITESQKKKIKHLAQKILDVRKNHSASLGDMYSNMPRDLQAAHKALDIAVDRAYRRQPFADEGRRLEYLFDEYHRLVAPVIPAPKKRRKRKSNKRRQK